MGKQKHVLCLQCGARCARGSKCCSSCGSNLAFNMQGPTKGQKQWPKTGNPVGKAGAVVDAGKNAGRGDAKGAGKGKAKGSGKGKGKGKGFIPQPVVEKPDRVPTEVEKYIMLVESAKEVGDEMVIKHCEEKLASARAAREAQKPEWKQRIEAKKIVEFRKNSLQQSRASLDSTKEIKLQARQAEFEKDIPRL